MGEAKRNLEEKKKAFEEDPQRFIDKRDIIFAAIIDEKEGQKGTGYLINEGIPTGTFIIAKYYMGKNIDMMLAHRKVMEMEKDKGGIIMPGGNGKNRIV